MTWPAVLFWALMFLAAASDGPALLYLFSIAGAFGTLQMVPSGAAGGATFLPQSVCAAILVAKVLLQPGNAARGIALALDPRRLALLAAFLVYALLTAAFLPRIFAGRVELFSVSGLLSGTSITGPSAGNITQSCYMILSIATAAAFAVIGTRQDIRHHYLMATLFGGLTVIVTGLIDMAAYRAGLGSLLDPFRNATYTLLTDVESVGVKRVVGLTSEASSYGYICVNCLSALTFLRPCYPPHLRRTVVPLTIAGLVVMASLSTSSSAYVGLATFVAVWALNWLIRCLARDVPARDDLRYEFMVVVAAAFGLLSLYVISPTSFAGGTEVLNSAIFEKTSSASFAERNTWTSFGWRAFLETGGLGVGLGSLRVSNWFVSILGSTGIVGAVLLFGFIIRILVITPSPRSPQGREWQRGLRMLLVPLLVMAGLIGTMPDMGVSVAALYGLLAVAGPLPRRAARLRPQQATAS